MVRPHPPAAGGHSAPHRCLSRLLLASLVLLSGALSGCTRVSMPDANDPDRASATFRYVVRQGTRSPDYGAIDAQILDETKRPGGKGAKP